MGEAVKKLDGAERAAVFLLTLGEQAAAEILRHMGPREVQQVGTAMAGLSEVSNQQIEVVVSEFADSVQERTSVGVGSEQYIRNIMVSALGEDKARSVVGSILMGQNSRGLESLRWMEPRAVSDLIKDEHPQIIAIVLSYLDSDQAANVLATLPAELRTDVIMRIVNLDTVNPTAMEELDEIIEKQFTVESNTQPAQIGGLKAAADIINFLDTPVETELLESIDAEDSGMSEQIRDQLFVFENLVTIGRSRYAALVARCRIRFFVDCIKGCRRNRTRKNLWQYVQACSRNVARRFGDQGTGSAYRSGSCAKKYPCCCQSFGGVWRYYVGRSRSGRFCLSGVARKCIRRSKKQWDLFLASQVVQRAEQIRVSLDVGRKNKLQFAFTLCDWRCNYET